MAKDQTTLILVLLGIVGAFLLLKKPAVARARVPAGVSGIAPGVAPAITPSPLPSGCESQMIAMAEQQLGLSRDQLSVRSLRPNDLGLGSTWSVNLASANAWNTVINASVPSGRFVCLKSVSYSGTAAEAIRVNAGASTVLETNIEMIPGITTTHTASIPDVIVQQNQNITVQVYASAVSATDNLILSGVVVEQRGMVVW